MYLLSTMWISKMELHVRSFPKKASSIYNASQFLHLCIPMEMFLENFSHKGSQVDCRCTVGNAHKSGEL